MYLLVFSSYIYVYFFNDCNIDIKTNVKNNNDNEFKTQIFKWDI